MTWLSLLILSIYVVLGYLCSQAPPPPSVPEGVCAGSLGPESSGSYKYWWVVHYRQAEEEASLL